MVSLLLSVDVGDHNRSGRDGKKKDCLFFESYIPQGFAGRKNPPLDSSRQPCLGVASLNGGSTA